ncbi:MULTISPECIES: hypothetical protein [Halorussus]|uniref:hypothetical protein n=1 Tax=Halorussus TaxID=1070314 RepID=UPI0013B39847|nr:MULTISPECIES: hypothetical protein [Halorussus]NHN58316.1 hypothetical protein [Halorussus sp. JP-T4]
MIHRTMYHWTTEEGCTHIFMDNHMPPSTGFGWGSLCDEWQLPIEGEHVEVKENPSKGFISCKYCKEKVNERNIDLDDEDVLGIRCSNHPMTDIVTGIGGCVAKDQGGNGSSLADLKTICHRKPLHHEISFEPEEVNGDPRNQVENVCDECLQSLVEREWSEWTEESELAVECWTDTGKRIYYAESIESVAGMGEPKLRLSSENGLTMEIPRERIESITLTEAQRVIH